MAESSGMEWEREFQSLCESRGLFPYRMHSASCYDFWCNGLRIQCKCVDYVEIKSRYKRCIRISRGSGCNTANNYNAGDFDLFAIKHDSRMFFVPTMEVGAKNGKMNRRLDLHVLHKFENAWHLIEDKKSFTGFVQKLLF